jgi:hypothetical protein
VRPARLIVAMPPFRIRSTVPSFEKLAGGFAEG